MSYKEKVERMLIFHDLPTMTPAIPKMFKSTNGDATLVVYNTKGYESVHEQ